MNIEEVKNKVKEVIKIVLEDRVEVEVNISNEEDLVSLLGINSIEAIEIIVRLENEFDMEVDDADLSVDFLKNIDSIANYIVDKVN